MYLYMPLLRVSTIYSSLNNRNALKVRCKLYTKGERLLNGICLICTEPIQCIVWLCYVVKHHLNVMAERESLGNDKVAVPQRYAVASYWVHVCRCPEWTVACGSPFYMHEYYKHTHTHTHAHTLVGLYVSMYGRASLLLKSLPNSTMALRMYQVARPSLPTQHS